MRKVATALALVLVSFAIGAFFSGGDHPWETVRARLRAWLDEPKGPQVLDKSLLVEESGKGIPAAPIPSFSFESERSGSTATAQTADPAPIPAPAAEPEPIPDPIAAAQKSGGAAPDKAAAKPEGLNVKLVGFSEPAQDSAPAADPKPTEGVAPPSDPDLARAGHEAAPAPEASWKRLCESMTELGVSRYWIEGEPNGPVKFRCVVPLVDERVVGQQFEAEGDDAIEAAEMALQRVSLWRASVQP